MTMDATVSAHRRRVLLIDACPLHRLLVRVRLGEEGLEFLESADGGNGVRRAREGQPDLILMDIQLPEVSGLEVTKWLKEDDDLKSIPVIAITAFAMKGDEERIREGGCEAYLSKPISVAKFLATVRAYLEPR